jgi:hypothetical protein
MTDTVDNAGDVRRLSLAYPKRSRTSSAARYDATKVPA